MSEHEAGTTEHASAPWWDYARLVEFKSALARLDPAGAPTLTTVYRARTGTPSRLILYPGSFNPPTLAHVGLAQTLIAQNLGDEVWFTLSVRTIDKEQVTGTMLEDRLAMLLCLMGDTHQFGVAIGNRGLYVDQAQAAYHHFPDLQHLAFLVGYDKLVQILDPRYYEDRDEALERLFRLASFFVARRGSAADDDARALLERPENQRFAHAIQSMPRETGDAFLALSSSAVRRLVAQGRVERLDVPPCVAQFIDETGAYQGRDTLGRDRYAVRQRIFEQLAAQGKQVLAGTFRDMIERTVGDGRPTS